MQIRVMAVSGCASVAWIIEQCNRTHPPVRGICCVQPLRGDMLILGTCLRACGRECHVGHVFVRKPRRRLDNWHIQAAGQPTENRLEIEHYKLLLFIQHCAPFNALLHYLLYLKRLCHCGT